MTSIGVERPSAGQSAPAVWLSMLLLGATTVLLLVHGSSIPGPSPPQEIHEAAGAVPFQPGPFPSRPLAGSASDPFYLQEGLTLARENNSTSTSFSPYLNENFTLESSPYATGYELNALTNTGDWIQAVASDDWPGGSSCPGGFDYYYELWNASGDSVLGPSCVLGTGSTFYPAAGNAVGLSIDLNCGAGGDGSVCLTFQDYTAGKSTVVTEPQPDPTATQFENLESATNSNRYFSGPMTEIVDDAATDCLSYEPPTVVYTLDSGFVVTRYVPWSDEFSPGGLSCYDNAGPTSTLGSSPVTQFYEASGGSGYGPHYEAAQNISAALGVPGRTVFETDAVPLFFYVSVSRTSLDVGQSVTITGSPFGGVSPWSCRWSVDGVNVTGETLCTWTYLASSPGEVNVSGFGVDNLSNYAANWTNLTVDPDPTVATPTASLTVGSVGEPVTFTAKTTPGAGNLTYGWAGLPTGCAGTTDPLPCVPTRAGTYSISLQVTDQNGGTATSSPLTFTVEGPPVQAPASVAPHPSTDVGQSVSFSASVSGGAGGGSYLWSIGTLTGCLVSSSSTLNCTPTAPGTFPVSYLWTDANGVVATGNTSLNFTVYPDPTVGTPTASRGAADAGQIVTFSSVATQGSGGLVYRWSDLPQGCEGATDPLPCWPSGAGAYEVWLAVTDSNGFTASSGPLGFMVYADPTVSAPVASPSTVLLGQSVSFSVLATPGSGGLVFGWGGLPSGCSSADLPTITCVPTSAGTYDIEVTVTDSDGGRATSTTLVFTVGPTLLGLPETQGEMLLGGGIAVAAGASGGTVLALRRRRRRQWGDLVDQEVKRRQAQAGSELASQGSRRGPPPGPGTPPGPRKQQPPLGKPPPPPVR